MWHVSRSTTRRQTGRFSGVAAAVLLVIAAVPGTSLGAVGGPTIDGAEVNVQSFIHGTGSATMSWSFEVFVFTPDGSADIALTADGSPLAIDSVERVDSGGGQWVLIGSGSYGASPPVLGTYVVTIADGTGNTATATIGVLEDYPEGAPDILYPIHEQPASSSTPTIEWEAFDTDYLGTAVEPRAYEINLYAPWLGTWYDAYPVENRTSIDFDDPLWTPEPQPLDPSNWLVSIHSNHEVVPGAFTFEHHRQIWFAAPSDNQAPVCEAAQPSTGYLWPPNHRFREVAVDGIEDPDGDELSVFIESIVQDEPLDEAGDGAFEPDGLGIGGEVAFLRAERAGGGDGRVYHIGFTAVDGKGGECSGEVTVGVPQSMGKRGLPPVDGGPLFDSTG